VSYYVTILTLMLAAVLGVVVVKAQASAAFFLPSREAHQDRASSLAASCRAASAV
jgi:hypothetical protein